MLVTKRTHMQRRRSGRREGSGRWRDRLAVRGLALAGAVLGASTGCSSMGLLPEEGGGAGWNLATVSYVNQSSSELEQRIVDRVLTELPGNLETLLIADRKRVSQLQERALGQETRIEKLEEDLEEAQRLTADLSASLQGQAEAFRSAAEQVRATTDRLDVAIQALPSETLRELRAALDAYLAAREAEQADPGGGAPAGEGSGGTTDPRAGAGAGGRAR